MTNHVWTIRIPIATPSGNTVLRKHWSSRGRQQQDMYWLITAALNKMPPIPTATCKRRLVVERHGKRMLDADNLAAGCKALIDVVKFRKLILDDNPEVCELVFRQAPASILDPFTLITLEDIA